MASPVDVLEVAPQVMTVSVYNTAHPAPPNTGVESPDIAMRYPWLQQYMAPSANVPKTSHLATFNTAIKSFDIE
jgi:hypothetical protein